MHTFEQGSCPACGVSWQGKKISKESQEMFRGTHFSRVIGIEYGLDTPQQYWYDGISEYRCPDCEARFNRWTLERVKDGEWVLPYGRKGADD